MTALLEDREGSIWVGDAARRPAPAARRALPGHHPARGPGPRRRPRRSSRITPPTCGSAPTVPASTRLTRRQEPSPGRWTMGLPSNVIWTLAETRDGAIWVGTPRRSGPHPGRSRDELRRRRRLPAQRHSRHPRGPARQPVDRQQPAGPVAACAAARSSASRRRRKALSSNSITVLARGPRRRPRIGTHGRRPQSAVARPLQLYSTEQGLRSNDVTAILCDDQHVWVGNDRRQPAPGAQRPCARPADAGRRLERARALQILDDDRGSIWMTGERGITRLEARRAAQGRQLEPRRRHRRIYDFRDGFGAGNSRASRSRPASAAPTVRWHSRARPASSSSAARLFAEVDGRPFVKVLDVLADGQAHPDRRRHRAAGRRQAARGALHRDQPAPVPSRVAVQLQARRRRRRLGRGRSATRRVLLEPPAGGRYRFQVKATNSDGVPNPRVASCRGASSCSSGRRGGSTPWAASASCSASSSCRASASAAARPASARCA